MANSTPTTPNSAPIVRRSFTAPTRLTDPFRPPPTIHSSDTIEILFSHPAAKIVTFSVSLPSSSPRPTSSLGSLSPDAGSPAATLIPWASPSERTLAAGQLQIYRVPPGVCFLNSGAFLRHIVAKTQMWCVDGVSKFVLKVGPTSFYRIELPAMSVDEKERVEEFKSAVAKLLQFEKTPSPFVTGQLQLDDPATPVKRKTARPRERAKKWRLNKIWEPEDAEHRARLKSVSGGLGTEEQNDRRDSYAYGVEPNDSDGAASFDGTEERYSSGDSSSVSEVEAATEIEGREQPQIEQELDTPAQPPETINAFPNQKPLPSSRSLTTPLTLTLPKQVSPATEETIGDHDGKDLDVLSITSSLESFHTVEESAKSPTETASFVSAKHRQDEGEAREDDIVEQFATHRAAMHSRHTSRTASTPDTPRPVSRPGTAEEAREGSDPSTPTLISDSGDDVPDHPWADVVTPPDTIRLRRVPRRMSGASQRPALKPLPHPADLFTSPRPGRRMSAVFIQKTCSVLIGPPAHLVALMLRIAARIVQGLPIIYSPLTPRTRRQKMAGSWESSADEEDEWDEDDYGIPLRNYPRGSNTDNPDALERDWGVD